MLALHAVDAEQPRRRGAKFLATMLGPDGRLRADVDAPRYPSYSLALGVLALTAEDAKTRDLLVAELRGRQLGPARGWAAGDLSYGAWSYFDGVPDRDPAVEGNLSVTLYAIGALVLSGVPPGDPALAQARIFVERCQGKDGGFFFSPVAADGNKAGADAAGEFRSYGSMTADGVRALLRLGLPPDHAKVAAGAAWLERRFDAERNPGDFPEVSEVRRQSAYYYWAWSAAHALRALGKPELTTERGRVRWAEALAEALLARQQADGSWSNRYTEMREDDPVVATSFAVAALAVCRQTLTGTYRGHAR